MGEPVITQSQRTPEFQSKTAQAGRCLPTAQLMATISHKAAIRIVPRSRTSDVGSRSKSAIYKDTCETVVKGRITFGMLGSYR
jgi:hypothetical protein